MLVKFKDTDGTIHNINQVASNISSIFDPESEAAMNGIAVQEALKQCSGIAQVEELPEEPEENSLIQYIGEDTEELKKNNLYIYSDGEWKGISSGGSDGSLISKEEDTIDLKADKLSLNGKSLEEVITDMFENGNTTKY